MANFINNNFRKLGFEIKPYPDKDLKKRLMLIKTFNVDLVLDIGASIGEYAQILRKNGYKNRIVSFEPIKKSFIELKNNASKDKLWDVFNYAIGDKNEMSKINVSENYVSSSLLKINKIHTEVSERSKIVDQENIEVRTLDKIFSDLYKNEKNIFVKIDTQGFENHVINGAKDTINKVIGLQIELSITPLYDTSVSYLDMIDLLNTLNFKLYSLEPGFYNKKTGQLLQFDGIFFNPSNISD